MDFFNKLTKKAKETYQGASKKTGELAKEAKLRMKMNENKSEINDLYKEIGKKVYEKHVLSEDINIKIDLEEECTKIDILSAEIETCLNKIRELKDKKQCPKCFNEIDLNANFCNHCGAKQQDEEEAREVEVVGVENNATSEATNTDMPNDSASESGDVEVQNINNSAITEETNNNDDSNNQ